MTSKRTLLLVAAALLLSPLALNACNLKCKYNLDCYNCISGGRLENCFLDCNVCGGLVCVGFAHSPGGGAAQVEENHPPLLTRFETKPLAAAIDPAVAHVMDWFWRWHDAKSKEGMSAPLNLEGGVVIDRKPYEFRLEVRQDGDLQVYSLKIEAYAKATLTLSPAVGGKQELAYELQRNGDDRLKAGYVMLEAE